MSDSHFIKDWKKKNIGIFQTMYPELTKKQLNKFLDKIIEDRMVNPKAKIHNNYVHKEIDLDLLGVIDWIKDTKPITAGFGVFFRNQHQAINPAAVMLSNFLKLRKKYKSELKNYLETSYEYGTFDRMQLTEKINANSYYGASGAPSSNFFNIYTATSVTATGQSLISTTQQAFEAFLANNVLFIDINDCMNFLENVRKEKHVLDDRFLNDVSVEQMIEYLSEQFYEYEEEFEPILYKYLSRLPQNILNRMYYKNNLYEFSKLPMIQEQLMKVLTKTKEFKDPNDLPNETKGTIEELWDYYREFVMYNHSAFNRIGRLKNDMRKAVVVVDTDSNMLNLKPWSKFLKDTIVDRNHKLQERDPFEVRFISINLMAYFITNMITCVLQKYTKDANIPQEYRVNINMKNEYLFTRLILTTTKKRYISSIRLREGKEIYPEKIDIKGLDFVKSTTREEASAYFTKLVKEELLYAENIDVSGILRKLEEFERTIMESLHRGEKKFLIPISVKEAEAYDDAFKMQGFRAVLAWNYLYPDQEIELPEKVDMVKVKMRNEDEIENLKGTHPEMYDIIVEKFFNNSNKKLADKGIQVIALPKNLESIPEWIVPYIDFDTITTDILKTFFPVLKSLELQPLKTSKKEYFSNILKL